MQGQDLRLWHGPADRSRQVPRVGARSTASRFWDPKLAGLAMNKIAKMLIDGKTVTNGMDLGLPGYTKVTVTKGPGKGIIVRGQGWVDVDKSNYKQYPF